jgi:hypothetical protein
LVVEERMAAGVLWARAVALGAVAVLLGVAGHVSADGLLPGMTGLGILGAVAVLTSLPMVGRQIRPTAMLVHVVAGQAVVHVALTMTAGHRGAAAGSMPTAPVAAQPAASLPVVDGHRVGSLRDAYHSGADTVAAGTGAPSPITHLVEDLAAHAPMMVAHLAAAALVALWLAHGERLLWDLAAMLGRRLVRALTVPAASVAPRASLWVPVRHDPTTATLIRLIGPHPRRGPPLPA